MPVTLELELELPPRGSAMAGEVLYGSAVLRGTSPQRALTLAIELDLVVEGDGWTEREPVHRAFLAEGQELPEGSYPFRLRLPPGPLGHQGTRLRVHHALSLVLFDGPQRQMLGHFFSLLAPAPECGALDDATIESLGLDPLLGRVVAGDAHQLGGLAEALRNPPPPVVEAMREGHYGRGEVVLRWDADGLELEGAGSAPIVARPGYTLRLRAWRALELDARDGRILSASHRLHLALDGAEGALLRACAPRGAIHDARLVDGLPFAAERTDEAPCVELAPGLLVRVALAARLAGAALERWPPEAESPPPAQLAALRLAPRPGALGWAHDDTQLDTALTSWPESLRAGLGDWARRAGEVGQPEPLPPPPPPPGPGGRLAAASLLGLAIALAAAAGLGQLPLVSAPLALLAVLAGAALAARDVRTRAVVDEAPWRGRACCEGLVFEEKPRWLAAGEAGVWIASLPPGTDPAPAYWRLECIERVARADSPRSGQRWWTERSATEQGPLEWREVDGARVCRVEATVPGRAVASAGGVRWRLRWRLALYREGRGGADDVLVHEEDVAVLPVRAS